MPVVMASHIGRPTAGARVRPALHSIREDALRKVLLSVMATLIFATGCGPAKPPQPGPSKSLITAQVVEICIEEATRIRFEYRICDNNEAGFRMVYIPNTPRYPSELPALGEALKGKQDPMLAPPEGSTPERISDLGAVRPR